MKRHAEEALLLEAGFTPHEKTKHTIWRHPSGRIWTTSYGSRQSNPRNAASLRALLRRLAREQSQKA